ncbi:MAG: hypothetical protein CMH31_06810 [Micavibrio sp.]|nr:hypothetical protein [Micavibrio sp.]
MSNTKNSNIAASSLHQLCSDEIQSFLEKKEKDGLIDDFEVERKPKVDKDITVFKVTGTHSAVRYPNYSLKASDCFSQHLTASGLIQGRSKLKDIYMTVTSGFKVRSTSVLTTANGYQKFVRAYSADAPLELDRFDRRRINPYLKRVTGLFVRLDSVFEARAEYMQRKIEKRAERVAHSPWGKPFEYRR